MNWTFMSSFNQLQLTNSWRKCAGTYCGHIENGTECGSCPWGTRVDVNDNRDSLCSVCTITPSLHGWMYLGFTVMMPMSFLFNFPSSPLQSPVTHSTCPNNPESSSGNRNMSTAIVQPPLLLQDQSSCGNPVRTCKYLSWGLVYFALHCLSAFVSILLFPPLGSLNLYSCVPQKLEDFYAPFLIVYGCPSEVVFPYLSLPLVYFAFSIFGCVLFYVAILLTPSGSVDLSKWLRVTHLSLYAYPVLGLVVFIFGGVLYYSYPYVILILAVIHSVYRFPAIFDYCAPTTNGSVLPVCHPLVVIRSLFCVPEPALALTLLVSLFCFGYSLISLDISTVWVLVFTFVPFLFYLLTLPFTHPFATSDGEERLQLALMRHNGTDSFVVSVHHRKQDISQERAIQPDSTDG
ncbi:hypothetical protein X801_06157 [Opisthorchis viverrini]|uniref:JNK1/MAPK8-associated membrane protein n=1 Tax=Opisthorchis viverrini TaxID=6198 RepID=A0A1S8WU83_OPIVI|nr:hypothetical protein X801_06157 [Opisthorchis viverrini]